MCAFSWRDPISQRIEIREKQRKEYLFLPLRYLLKESLLWIYAPKCPRKPARPEYCRKSPVSFRSISLGPSLLIPMGDLRYECVCVWVVVVVGGCLPAQMPPTSLLIDWVRLGWAGHRGPASGMYVLWSRWT